MGYSRTHFPIIVLENINKDRFTLDFDEYSMSSLIKRIILFSNLQPITIHKFIHHKSERFFECLNNKAVEEPIDFVRFLENLLRAGTPNYYSTLFSAEADLAAYLHYNKDISFKQIKERLDLTLSLISETSGHALFPDFMSKDEDNPCTIIKTLDSLLVDQKNKELITKLVEDNIDVSTGFNLDDIVDLPKSLLTLYAIGPLHMILPYAVQFLKEHKDFSLLRKYSNKCDRLFIVLLLLSVFTSNSDFSNLELEPKKRKVTIGTIIDIIQNKLAKFEVIHEEMYAELYSGPLKEFFKCTDKELSKYIKEFLNIGQIKKSPNTVRDTIELGFNLKNILELTSDAGWVRHSSKLFSIKNPEIALTLLVKAGLVKKIKDTNNNALAVIWYKDWDLEYNKEAKWVSYSV